jgi:peptidoglycan/LPS O-acetylase OafA/YrhL
LSVQVSASGAPRSPPPATADASPAYQPELDGMRAIAILFVLVYHLWTYRGDSWLGIAISTVAHQGWMGVDVFFVLSGFLITRILRAKVDSPRYYASFYIRRSLRIFPVYYAVLLLLTVMGLAAPHFGVHLSEPTPAQTERIWLNYLYLSNFALALLGSNAIPLDISWSLAVEEQFYLVYPGVVRRLRGARLERALWVVIGIAIPLRAFSYFVFPGNHYGPYALPYCRMDTLAMGCLLALVLERPPSRSTRMFAAAALPLVALAFVLGTAILRTLPVFATIGYTVTGAAASAVLLRIELGGWPSVQRMLRSRPLVAVGRVSYGLYLLHLFVRAAVGYVPGLGDAATYQVGTALLRTAVAMAASLGVAALSWHLFEKRILRLKDRLDVARRPRTANKGAA